MCRFLHKINVPVTATAVSEIIQRKADNPKDFIEKLLKLWKAEATVLASLRSDNSI
jgi:hypothetical protein